MKIYEILAVTPTGVTVGNAGSETMMMHPPEQEDIPRRREQHIQQPGYMIRLGDKLIPTPQDQPGNHMGVVNSVVGG